MRFTNLLKYDARSDLDVVHAEAFRPAGRWRVRLADATSIPATFLRVTVTR